MTLSNQKNMNILRMVFLCMIFFLFLKIILNLLVYKSLNIITGCLILFCIIIFILLRKLHYTEYENSGYIISIRKISLLGINSKMVPILEFPLYLLHKFCIKNNHLYLWIRRNGTVSDPKLRFFKVSLFGFTVKQRTQIEILLSEQIKNIYEFQRYSHRARH